jgi:hypothetical protein
MRQALSVEALELHAAGALRMDGDFRHAHANELPPPEHPYPFPDVSTFAEAARKELPVDPWRATLLADAWVVGHRRRALASLRRRAIRASVKLRKDEPEIPWESSPAALLTEVLAPRREALRVATDASAPNTHDGARAVVDALRNSIDALDPALVPALALGDDGHGDLYDATDDVLRELDLWACHGLGLDPKRLTWADRLHTLLGPATLRALSPPTWTSLGCRAWLRLGLDPALRGVVDDLRPASTQAKGVAVIPIAPGEQSVVAGRPVRAGSGAGEVLGALAEAVSQTLGRGPFPGVRRGCDRALDGVAHALGRRLLFERHWLKREGEVDALPRERVMCETLHAEVLRMRLDVALARFFAHVLARRPDAGARFDQELTRAWGIAPPPSWAPWVAASLYDGNGPWSARPAGRALGARVEPLVVDVLRSRFDEDWFRNPNAGRGVAAVFDDMRAIGVRAWCEAHGGMPDGAATARRFAEALRDARRTGSSTR